MESALDFKIQRAFFSVVRIIENCKMSMNFFAFNYLKQIFLLEKAQLAALIYDLFINKCHFIGLIS